MPEYRFRRTEDVIIPASDEEEARSLIGIRDRYPDEYELLGTVDTEKLTQEELAFSKKMGEGYLVMSVQYRGENFACLCTVKEEENPELVRVRPIALLLKDKQKGHITDVMGQSPESGQRQEQEP